MSRFFAVCLLAAASACFHPNFDDPLCGPEKACPRGWTCNAQNICIDPAASSDLPDAGMIGATPPGCQTFSAQFDTCKLGSASDLTISGNASYSTDTGQLQLESGELAITHMTLATKAGPVDAIYAHDVHLTMGSALVAKGTLPLAIVATGSIVIDTMSLIDVSNGGAGASAVCTNPVGVAGNDPNGGGGGGGAGYAAAGGNGGKGDSGQTNGASGSESIGMPPGPVGGCAGGNGGRGSNGLGGAGGLGGGALYLVAADTISLGDVAALSGSGGGGRGGPQPQGGNSGGGGGGSGGMIWLEAPHIVGAPSSLLIANGGGGGEGSDSNHAGQDGQAGQLSATQAHGGSGGALNGGDGGSGGAGGPVGHPAGSDGSINNNASGGGGGGGVVGYIHIVSPDQHVGTSSPPPT